jgi:hypothetical protein
VPRLRLAELEVHLAALQDALVHGRASEPRHEAADVDEEAACLLPTLQALRALELARKDDVEVERACDGRTGPRERGEHDEDSDRAAHGKSA